MRVNMEMDIESERQRIDGFIDKGNYHAAVNLAISALNECRRNNDQAGVDIFIGVSRHVIDEMAGEFGTKKTRDK